MLESSDTFEVRTDSTIPDMWEQDTGTGNVFAWLRPMNQFACHAFHHVVDHMIRNPGTQLLERKFVHLDGKDIVTLPSASESDEPDHQEATDQSQWVGSFKFSTAVYPRDPAKGWILGTGRGKSDVDVVIGPPDPKRNSNQVRGIHARLYIHRVSCRPTVEAFHSIQVSGSTGIKHVARKIGVPAKVLESGHQVQIGRCTYVFTCGDAMTNGNFKTSLPEFMKLHHGEHWKPHPIVSITSTGSYHTIDQFSFLPGAFADGTFGEVTAGWAQDGSAVAIKRFKKPSRSRLNQHRKIMGLIGRHPNVLELLHSSSDFESEIPAIYCVYSPLALACLKNVLQSHTMNLPAQIALLVQYLRGLAYLHDVKGIMHRDIKPHNLGVLSLDPPRGVILDLDAATTEETSDDCGQGSVPYQAPEIVNLRMESFANPVANPPRYGRLIDVWALGMSAFCAFRGQHTRWNDFDYGPTRGRLLPGTTFTNYVLETRLEHFYDVVEIELVEGSEECLEYFGFLMSMTMYDPDTRPSASRALTIAEALVAGQGETAIEPIHTTQGTKRKIGEVR